MPCAGLPGTGFGAESKGKELSFRAGGPYGGPWEMVLGTLGL